MQKVKSIKFNLEKLEELELYQYAVHLKTLQEL